MGVYIAGMEMPKKRETITITICDDGIVFEEWKEPGSVFKAIPVQPHGRLIDADALIAWFEEWYDPNADLEICHVIDILDDNSVTPTIIPADPAEEGE